VTENLRMNFNATQFFCGHLQGITIGNSGTLCYYG
jgi:hypothetical protein